MKRVTRQHVRTSATCCVVGAVAHGGALCSWRPAASRFTQCQARFRPLPLRRARRAQIRRTPVLRPVRPLRPPSQQLRRHPQLRHQRTRQPYLPPRQHLGRHRLRHRKVRSRRHPLRPRRRRRKRPYRPSCRLRAVRHSAPTFRYAALDSSGRKRLGLLRQLDVRRGPRSVWRRKSSHSRTG